MFHVEKALDDEALIAHLCDRFHEPHRHELARLPRARAPRQSVRSAAAEAQVPQKVR